METIDKATRLLSLYIAAVIGASALAMFGYVFCLFTTIYYFATATTLMCFLAFPVGSALGMYLLDKWCYEPPRHFIWRVLAAVLMGVAGFMLIAVSVSQNQRDILLSPLPQELFLHSVIISFFSLIGYLLAGLLEKRWKRPEDDDEVFAAHRKRLRAVLFFGFLAMLVAIGYCIMFIPLVLSSEIEAAGAEEFFQEFLASIIDDTDFYKNHSSEPAIEQIHTHRSLFNNNYDTYRNICQRGWYEYAIIFNENNRFEVGIEGTNRNFFVSNFTYTGITKKRSFSDPKPLKTGEATKFFRRIIASINNETDFYKRHSDESTIQQIQANRSMISSNDILAYRHIEGEWEDFYFYVVFDEKHVFEVHVGGSEKGFLVKSFEYIGKNDGKWKIRGLDKVSH